jgi:uncharacterized membrane-anchored protein YitT (DUF2179 family)
MKKITVLLFLIGINIFPEDLKINKTYDNKPYKLYSVYSFEEKEDAPFGFLGKNLGNVLKVDEAAMWEFRKYQAAKLVGSGAMITGILAMFFQDFKLTKSGKIGINVIAGATVMAIGYGIGFNYANYSLNNAVRIFNKNKGKREKSINFFFDFNQKNVFGISCNF